LVLVHGEANSAARVDVGVARWPERRSDPGAESPSRPTSWVDVPATLANQLHVAALEVAERHSESTPDGMWRPATLTMNGAAQPAHRLDHTGLWVAYTRLGHVVVHVLTYGACGDIALVPVDRGLYD
jgi:hypothetical protein